MWPRTCEVDRARGRSRRRSVRARVALVVALAVVLVVPAAARDGSASLERLRAEALDGSQVAPFAPGDAKAVVLVFVRTDCPVSNRYAPELERLFEAFATTEVRFWLVYCDADESAADIRAHLDAYAIRIPALRDARHDLVHAAGARVTPEAAVFVRSAGAWQRVYLGRVDDRYVALGTARPAPTERDLERVLDAVAAGRVPPATTTTAVGCFIADLP